MAVEIRIQSAALIETLKAYSAEVPPVHAEIVGFANQFLQTFDPTATVAFPAGRLVDVPPVDIDSYNFNPTTSILTLGVRRTLPLSSSHGGQPMKLAFHFATDITAFSAPFIVLAKQGKIGSTIKVAKVRGDIEISAERAAIRAKILEASGAPVPQGGFQATAVGAARGSLPAPSGLAPLKYTVQPGAAAVSPRHHSPYPAPSSPSVARRLSGRQQQKRPRAPDEESVVSMTTATMVTTQSLASFPDLSSVPAVGAHISVPATGLSRAFGGLSTPLTSTTDTTTYSLSMLGDPLTLDPISALDAFHDFQSAPEEPKFFPDSDDDADGVV